MRQWIKYLVADARAAAEIQGDSNGLHVFDKEVDEDEARRSLASKEAYFKTFFHDLSRIRNYDDFVSDHLNISEKVLGVGSGRCANELMLMERGYQVTCSDVAPPVDYPALQGLFPQVKHITFDVLSKPAPEKFDALLTLSVIHQFNDDDLPKFFKNAYLSLHDGGHLILDSSGSPDNLLSYLVLDVLLKYEAKAARKLRSKSDPDRRVVMALNHGFRRTDKEILSIAGDCGFQLASRRNYGFLTEFERSFLLRNLIHNVPGYVKMMSQLGKMIPYTRMFDLKKA